MGHGNSNSNSEMSAMNPRTFTTPTQVWQWLARAYEYRASWVRHPEGEALELYQALHFLWVQEYITMAVYFTCCAHLELLRPPNAALGSWWWEPKDFAGRTLACGLLAVLD